MNCKIIRPGRLTSASKPLETVRTIDSAHSSAVPEWALLRSFTSPRRPDPYFLLLALFGKRDWMRHLFFGVV